MALWKDWRFILGVAAAYILLYVTFLDKDIFWYIYTAATLFFISISIISEPIDDQQNTNRFMLYGILSGVVLYALFAAGYALLKLMPVSAEEHVSSIYALFSPVFIWHYIVLVLIIIPGEELFFRGFIQKRLGRYMNKWAAMVTAALFYASVFVFSGEWLWMMAAFCGGLFWGSLYIWRKSIPMLIISHLIFDLLFVVFLPLA
ncbi:CPBP family intramembrane metalloprotease [Domibacillus sp. PGB-M46]|uniref:CPBP family intramembrane glutamic endopeptidase n=1 Tax=Domibacillus sp. PGB-M46 TaxID=2910255 RepID=UPI001F5AA966|nr:CPBP family intramembrane glutamic endopeptidase [Domibacillus sp. PGB-M46]MCI2253282.1 CPBP family intramembrane metalloprotease [Domibacillus sp. PGB-M46]